MTLDELNRRFPNEDAARAHLFRLRWPDGKVHCPRCGKAERVYRRTPKTGEMVSYRWVCKDAEACKGYGFSLTTGTIFEDTKIPLMHWFRVLLLMLTAKKGMSALQIQRTVFGQTVSRSGKVVGKGSYETTWYMAHRLRAAMQSKEFLYLSGVVEVDETFVGGSAKNAHRKNRGERTTATITKSGNVIPPKTAVIGAIARKGNVVCQIIEGTDRKTLQTFVRQTVHSNVSLVATDDHPGYAHLERTNRYGYPGLPHESVKHMRGEYVKETVRGVVHTAHIDSFWSLLKRGVMGSFHKVSKDYLPLYLAEFSFRHNQRGVLNAETFDRVLESC
jgi:transposase-like protein